MSVVFRPTLPENNQTMMKASSLWRPSMKYPLLIVQIKVNRVYNPPTPRNFFRIDVNITT